VLSVGYKPDKELLKSFNHVAPEVYIIGDAVEVSNIGIATRSGHQTSYNI
jgi:hypothetical protein